MSHSTPPVVWTCRGANVPHMYGNTHTQDIEDGVPFYPLQQQGYVRVTVCPKCHGRLPGHMINLDPGRDRLERYFQIESVDRLFEILPSGYVGTGTSRQAHRRLFEYCMYQPYSLYPNHAGRSLQASLVHQWDDPTLRPDGYSERIKVAVSRLKTEQDVG